MKMTELKKTVTLGRGVVLAMLMVIGSGLLGLPGLVADVGTVQEVVYGWLLIILAAMPLIQICARLGVKFPYSGGISLYAREAVGEWGGYAVTALVCGSFMLGEPAVALIGGEYLQHLFNLPDSGVYLLAILIATAMTLITVAGVRLVSLFNYAAVAVLLFLIAALTYFNFEFFASGFGFSAEALSEGLSSIAALNFESLDPYRIWQISALLFWAFLGWENLSFSLGEIKDPEKNVPRLYWLSFVLVTSIYLLLAFISAGAKAAGVPLQGAAGLSGLVRFTPGGDLLVWFMVIVVAANACSWNFTASRLLFSGGRTGIFPESLGKLSVKSIPVPALAVPVSYTHLTLPTTPYV
jgi:amino acid efflux transporter